MSNRVILSTKTFDEAGGNDVFPSLENVGSIAAYVIRNSIEDYRRFKGRLDVSLEFQAHINGCTYIFDVKYEGLDAKEGEEAMATGIGYAP